MVIGVRALGDFQFQHPRFQVVLFKQQGKKFGKVIAVEVQARQVYGNGNDGFVFVKAFTLQSASLFPNKAVKADDKAVALKFAGRNHTVHGVEPTHESFGTYDGIFMRVENRLQENRKLAFAQSHFQVAGNQQLLNHLVAHFRIVIGVARQVTAFDSAQCHTCAVAHLVNRQIGILDGVNAREEQNVMAYVQVFDSFVKVFDNFFNVEFRAWNAQDKMIGVGAATQRRSRIEHLIKIFRGGLQNHIARLHVKQVVNNFKAAYVHAND